HEVAQRQADGPREADRLAFPDRDGEVPVGRFQPPDIGAPHRFLDLRERGTGQARRARSHQIHQAFHTIEHVTHPRFRIVVKGTERNGPAVTTPECGEGGAPRVALEGPPAPHRPRAGANPTRSRWRWPPGPPGTRRSRARGPPGSVAGSPRSAPPRTRRHTG